MTDIEWTAPGVTQSHKNAAKEFGLPEQEIIEAIRSGTLNYQIAYAHGNPYYKVVRAEVEALAVERYGLNFLHEYQLKKRQDDIDREIRKLKRRINALEKEKESLASINQ